jgi:hypothetical protein
MFDDGPLSRLTSPEVSTELLSHAHQLRLAAWAASA